MVILLEILNEAPEQVFQNDNETRNLGPHTVIQLSESNYHKVFQLRVSNKLIKFFSAINYFYLHTDAPEHICSYTLIMT
jgi:hypothetical protein